MIVRHLVQGTAAWFAWRRAGIGASDMTVLMGEVLDPKRPVTVDDLLREKLRQGQREETFAMRRGRTMESPARLALQEVLGLALRPACVEHAERPWLRASLDGLSFLADVVAEIKCPKVLDHEVALAGVVPHHYRWQCQWQLLVTGLDEGLYASYSVAERFGGQAEPSLAVVPVAASAELQGQLLEAAEAFWQRLQEARSHPPRIHTPEAI